MWHAPVLAGTWAQTLYVLLSQPPVLFVVLEVVTMLPRAVRGHLWYHEHFREKYPSARRAVIPYVL